MVSLPLQPFPPTICQNMLHTHSPTSDAHGHGLVTAAQPLSGNSLFQAGTGTCLAGMRASDRLLQGSAVPGHPPEPLAALKGLSETTGDSYQSCKEIKSLKDKDSLSLPQAENILHIPIHCISTINPFSINSYQNLLGRMHLTQLQFLFPTGKNLRPVAVFNTEVSLESPDTLVV